eukprot:162986-Heterocapsa_arctica.AAC.1
MKREAVFHKRFSQSRAQSAGSQDEWAVISEGRIMRPVSPGTMGRLDPFASLPLLGVGPGT